MAPFTHHRVALTFLLLSTCLLWTTTTSFQVMPVVQKRSSANTLNSRRIVIQMSDKDESSESVAAATQESLDPFESYNKESTSLVTKDVVVGTGEDVQVGDIVTVKYKGRIFSFEEEDTKKETQFDSGTFSFKLGDGQVIPGWDEGLQGTKVGSQRLLRIPPNLAYGDRGGGDKIPPNAHLEFECEIQSVAQGPVAEFMANMGLGLNLRTAFIALFILSIILPKLGIGEKGFI